jgi:hypothetical protein
LSWLLLLLLLLLLIMLLVLLWLVLLLLLLLSVCEIRLAAATAGAARVVLRVVTPLLHLGPPHVAVRCGCGLRHRRLVVHLRIVWAVYMAEAVRVRVRAPCVRRGWCLVAAAL